MTAFYCILLIWKLYSFDPLYLHSCVHKQFYNTKDDCKNEDERTQTYPLSMYLKIQGYTLGNAPSHF